MKKNKEVEVKENIESEPIESEPTESKLLEKIEIKKNKPVARSAVKSEVKEPEAPQVDLSQQIWNAVKDRDLGLFGLTGQTVNKYCTPLFIDPNKCMLKYKVSSVIPALETVTPDFNLEVMDAYLILSKKD